MFNENLRATEDIRVHLGHVLKGIVLEMTSCADLEVNFVSGENTTIYTVKLPQQFRGKLIGAQGKNITSLRNIVGAMAGNHGFRAVIELVL